MRGKPRDAAHHVDRRLDARPDPEAGRALAHERLEAVDHRCSRRPGRRRRAPSRSSPYARSTTVSPGVELDEHLVADRRRVDDQVAAGRVGRPVARARVDARVGGQRRSERERRAAGADHAGAPCLDAGEDLLVGVEAERRGRRGRRACSPPRPRPRRSAATTACLCGIVTFAPAKPSARRAATAADRVLDVERRVVASRGRPPRTRRSASAARASARPDGRAARRAVVNSRTRARTRTAGTRCALAVKK